MAPRPAGAGSYPVGLALGANSTGYSALQNKELQGATNAIHSLGHNWLR